MPIRTVEIDDTLDSIVEGVTESLRDILTEWLDENADPSAGEPDTPDLASDLDYAGRVHEKIDSSVPILTYKIRDIFYLHGEAVENAFDDAGIGGKRDGDWPSGWKAAAIYCYIEQKVNEWYANQAGELTAQWWADNRPAVVAVRDHNNGDFDGLVVSDTSQVPDHYIGGVLHVNDHGNATLYNCDGDRNLEEIDAIV